MYAITLMTAGTGTTEARFFDGNLLAAAYVPEIESDLFFQNHALIKIFPSNVQANL